jgi:hypothetical protein
MSSTAGIARISVLPLQRCPLGATAIAWQRAGLGSRRPGAPTMTLHHKEPDHDRDAHGDEMLLTIFLKHRQSMNLGEINQKLEATGFRKKFPPKAPRCCPGTC